jgi:hypothetical protein
MCGPTHNDRSAPSTWPLTAPRHWWICWSMRCSIAAPFPSSRRLTTSRNLRRYGGSTAHRSTPWLVPPLHINKDPRRRSPPRRRGGTPRRVSRRRHGGGSGFAGDGGERKRTGRWAGCTCPPNVHFQGTGAAGDRPCRRWEDDRHARPDPRVDPRRRPSTRLGPVGGRAAVLPASAPTASPNSPGHWTMATFRTGRQRSAHRPW